MTIIIEFPWALMLLLLIPAGIHLKEKAGGTTEFSSVVIVEKSLQASFFKTHAATFLAVGAIFFGCLAVANPQYSSYLKKVQVESRWIMLVQDLSGSMNRLGEEKSNMTLGDICLEGAKAFIDMRDKDDLIGLVAFSSYAKLICPPTFDKTILTNKLNLLKRKSDSMVFRELTAGGGTNASYATWLALCTFLMLMPADHRLTYEELSSFRHSLLGKTENRITVPEKLKKVSSGHGMAIVLFTDGRIEANKNQEDIRKGLPNFVNVINLLRQLDIRLYLSVVSREIDPDVKAALEKSEIQGSPSRIFYMPKRFDREKISTVYEKIHTMEKNQLMVRWEKVKKQTRTLFSWISLGFLTSFWCLQTSSSFKHL